MDIFPLRLLIIIQGYLLACPLFTLSCTQQDNVSYKKRIGLTCPSKSIMHFPTRHLAESPGVRFGANETRAPVQEGEHTCTPHSPWGYGCAGALELWSSLISLLHSNLEIFPIGPNLDLFHNQFIMSYTFPLPLAFHSCWKPYCCFTSHRIIGNSF